jgi:hypothetical protein
MSELGFVIFFVLYIYVRMIFAINLTLTLMSLGVFCWDNFFFPFSSDNAKKITITLIKTKCGSIFKMNYGNGFINGHHMASSPWHRSHIEILFYFFVER